MSKLHIGLHSETLSRSDGIIAGSEVTTLGLQRAFQKRLDIANVSRYAPDQYEGLIEQPLDLMIIEGWDPTLPKFIATIRQHHPHAKILLWNLTYYGLYDVLHLDIDGYLTNSQEFVPALQERVPTLFLLLAADPELFRPLPAHDPYRHEVVYLGRRRQHEEEIQERFLLQASAFDFGLYGARWEGHPLLSIHYRGILPFNAIATLYNSAKIVLCSSESRQRKAGMINNRVFEALACEACVVSEHFPALESLCGDLLTYARESWDVLKAIKILLNDTECRKEMGRKGREWILKEHTYDHRVASILEFYCAKVG